MTEMKQPHEDIRGVDRSDNWLLNLEPEAHAHRDALIALTRHLRDATGVGNPAPAVQRMAERMRNPQIGDLVVESGKGLYTRDPDTRLKALGYLVEKRREWWDTDDEWEQHKAEDGDPDAERPIDTAWYIQYGPNPEAICRWTDCDFLVVPINPDEFARPVGRRDGTGVVLTRDDLLGSLADSGFTLNIS